MMSSGSLNEDLETYIIFKNKTTTDNHSSPSSRLQLRALLSGFLKVKTDETIELDSKNELHEVWI